MTASSDRMKQPCILLLHANGMCRDTWQPCVEELKSLLPAARIEYWDLLGHGKTSTTEMPLPPTPEEFYATDWDLMAIDVMDRPPCPPSSILSGACLNPGPRWKDPRHASRRPDLRCGA